ncbi:MAG TPA: hypothetical protein VJQ56_05655, partial [Blastocatellia bacterium]|nr:hypothetical protein [Blastocatellia bacterium]
LNHFNAGWSRVQVANRNTTEGFRPSVELGFPADATQDLTFPRIGFPGYGDILSPEGDVRSYQNIGSTFFTDSLGDNTVQFSDFVTWVKGRHTLKFGANAQWQQFNVHQFLDAGGTFNFRHDQTAADRDPDGGWPIASLITGATEFSFVNFRSIDPGWRYFTPSFFVNDDFKVTPRLTLNLGIRYDIPYPRTEARDRFRGFSPDAINPVVGRPGAIIGAGGQGGLQAEHEGLVETDYSNISPRFGFAYSLDSRTVVRGGAGIYYSPLLYGFNGQNSIAEGTLGYSTGALRTPDGRNATFFLSDFPPLPPVDPNGQFIGSDVDYFDPNFKTGRTVQWSLDIQRELFSNFAVSIGYIGHKGTRLKSNFERLNAIPLEALRLGFPLLTKPLADVTPAERAYAASVGVPLPANPNAVFAGFNGNVAQALKPFPQYGIINNQLESQGQSWYNALQIKVERRFTNGLQFGASYTFSKLITNAAEDLFGASPIGGVLQNPYDRQSLRTVSPNNAPHVFVMNYLFELPFGRGRRFLDRGGWVDRVIGGWQIGGIHRYQSGLPIVAFTSENTDFLRVAGFNGNLRLNLTGNPILFDIPPNGIRFPAVNRSAFVAPPNFQAPPTTDVTSPQYAAFYADPLRFFGNAPPVLEDARLLPYSNEDFSIMKKTRVTETVVVEFRTEFFNLFNRARYFFPDQDFRNPAVFGFSGIINDFNISAPRSIQLGLKVIF